MMRPESRGDKLRPDKAKRVSGRKTIRDHRPARREKKGLGAAAVLAAGPLSISARGGRLLGAVIAGGGFQRERRR